jgi:hypothetical protein
MTGSWKRFLFVRFPVAVVAIGVLCQLAAASLAHLPLRRNRIDELALAVVNDHQPHRVVLLGDSIIRNATLQYSVGTLPEVVNLSTQQYVGLPGDFFLLRRYLENHPVPKHVVVAAAPDDYHVIVNPQTVHYYMWNTFSRPDEHAFLQTYMPGINARAWYPAAMDIQERILEPLITLAKRSPAHFDTPPPVAEPDAPVEPASDNQASVEAQDHRLSEPADLSLEPVFAASVAGMCQLSRQYGFVLDIVWAPMPERIEVGRVQTKQLDALQNQLKAVFASTGCNAGPFFNMNDVQAFTNFDSGAFHLRGSGWEERAASILGRYIRDLPDTSSSRPPRVDAGGQAFAPLVERQF